MGPARSTSRFRLKLLVYSVREHVAFDDVTVSTKVSPEFIAAARTAANNIVGKEFKHMEASA